MKRNILATYVRESTLPHYCKSAWAYMEHIVKIECSFDDYSEERSEQAGDEDYQMVTYRKNLTTGQKEEVPINELFSDKYTVTTTDARGVKKFYCYKTKDAANKAFIIIKSNFTGWRKV